MTEQVRQPIQESTVDRVNTGQRHRGSFPAYRPNRGNFAPITSGGRSPEFWRNKHVPGETDVARQLRLASRHFDRYGNPVSHPLVAAPFKNRRPLAQQNNGDNKQDEHPKETTQAAASPSPVVSNYKIEPKDVENAAKRASMIVATPPIDSKKHEDHSKTADTSAMPHANAEERKQSLQESNVSPTAPAAMPCPQASAKVENSVDAQATKPEASVDQQNHMSNNDANFRKNNKSRYGNGYRNNRNSYRNNRNNRRNDGPVFQSNTQSPKPASPLQPPEKVVQETSSRNDSTNKNQSSVQPETTKSLPATASAAQDELSRQQSPTVGATVTKLANESAQEATANATGEGSFQVDVPVEPECEPEISSDTIKKGRRKQRWQKNKARRTRVQKWAKTPNLRKTYGDDECYSDYWDDGHHRGQLAMVNVEPIAFDDPDYDVKQLMDWEGGWIPAPIEWEDRTGYLERNFKERMHNYIKALEEVSMIDISAPLFLATNNTEIATRSWIPILIDNITPKSWWAKHLKTSVTEIEPNAKPWWELYAKPDSDFLKGWYHHETKLNPEDPQFELAKQDEGSDLAFRKVKGELGERLRMRKNSCVLSIDNNEKDQQNYDNDNKTKVNNSRPKVTYEITKAVHYVPQNAPKRIKPKSNIFLREALQFDVTQITDIYNHHVNNSIHVAERHELSVEEMRTRMNELTANEFPFLVAVDRFARSNVNPNSTANTAHNNNRQHRRQSRTHPSMEKIIGFAFADDYHSSESMYRYTCEFEIYVHADYYRQRIGSCLMDKMTSLMDAEYSTRGGYAFHDRGNRGAGRGLPYELRGSRRVGTVICHVPYASDELKKKRRASKSKNKEKSRGERDDKLTFDDGNDDDNEVEKGRSTWLFAWLGKFGYEKVGDLPEVGVKMGQFVNLAIFHRKTGFPLEPAYEM